MVQKQIPEDMRKHKTSMGIFTIRRLMYSIGAAASAFVGNAIILRPFGLTGMLSVSLGSAFFAMPCLLLGFADVLGMPFSKFFRQFVVFLLTPQKRKDESILMPKKIEKQNKVKLSKKLLEEHPEYVKYQ